MSVVSCRHVKGQNSTMNSSASSSTSESTSAESIHNKEEIQGQLGDVPVAAQAVEAPGAVESTQAKSEEDEDEEEEPEDDEDEEIPQSDEDEYEVKDMSANLTSNGLYAADKKVICFFLFDLYFN